jgi:DNA polymerase-3 subunit gamma/tau
MLYRIYQPKTFAAMLGESPKLMMAVAERKRSGSGVHSIMCYGQRGTGKTASARIMARALNCENYQDGVGPCNECKGCLSSDRPPVLNQFDAAAFSSADDAREVTSAMRSIPSGRQVTYIFDEAHNMSIKAMDVLLLPIEEPRDRLTIILCTTEPQKITTTIASRCARVAFRAVSPDELIPFAERVIAEQAPGMEYDRPDLEQLVRASSGSPRDMLSLLDTAMAVGSLKRSLANIGLPFAGQLRDLLLARDLGGASRLVLEKRHEFSDAVREVGDVFAMLVDIHEQDPSIGPVVDLLMEALIKAGRANNKGLAPYIIALTLGSKVNA